MANAKVISDATSLRIKPEQPSVLGRAVVSQLEEAERTIPDHFKVGPIVRVCRAQPSQQPLVLRLVVRREAINVAHRCAPNRGGSPVQTGNAHDAGAGAPSLG
jgi:hypothetical protein